MLETIITFLSQLPWGWVLIFAFLSTLAENLFPPVPGDSILVFMGTLIGIQSHSFLQILALSIFGSTLGFVVMYILGKKFEIYFIENNKFKFISRDSIKKVELWFEKYGYWLIVANRFLSGTRAVISFFAGMSRLDFKKTILLSAISSTLWNLILLYFGYSFGENWQVIDNYISIYGKIIFPIVILIILIAITYQFYFKKKLKSS